MLAAQFSPGPDMMMLLKNAVTHPLRAGLFTVLGIAAGLCVHLTAILLGLAVVFQTYPMAARVLGIGGGLYLAWLSWQLLRSVLRAPDAEQKAARANGPETPLPDRAAFAQGMITNLLNPKAILFLLGVLSPALQEDSGAARKLAFAGIIIGQALVFWSLFVWLLKRRTVRDLYLAAERPLNLAFGLGLLGWAVTAFVKAC